MSNKKYCPMTFNGAISNPGHLPHEIECNENKCAWWKSGLKACSINVIAEELFMIKEQVFLMTRILNERT